MAIGKRIELQLPCTLTEHELSSRSMMLVETITAVDETNAARSGAMKEYKDRLTALEERQRELARAIRTGIEDRMVACIAEYHTPVEATKRVIRLDTGEVVREEAMSAAECQLHMFDSKVEFEKYMKSQTPEPLFVDPPDDSAAEPSASD